MNSGTLRYSQTAESYRRAMHLALWTVQILLAALFGAAGFAKCFQPLAELAAGLPWAAEVPARLVRFIGAMELLGAAGLLLPALTRVAPFLTGGAALGLVVEMVFALVFHLGRNEGRLALIPVLLGLLAAFVAWGRLNVAPIPPRRGPA